MESLDKANELVLTHKVKSVQSNSSMIWGVVESEKAGEVAHTPWVARDAKGCTCVAFTMSNGECKHISAILVHMGLDKLVEWVSAVGH